MGVLRVPRLICCRFVYPCGDVYEGEWKAGKYHGAGKYTSVDSDGHALEYEGEWKGDKMNGHGRYVYKDTGDVYEGNFINGFREGFGKYTRQDSDRAGLGWAGLGCAGLRCAGLG